MSANHRYGIRSALKVLALTVMACTGLTACGSWSNATSGMSSSSINPVNWITPYKVDVIQGNFISKEQVEFLKAGMTRAQVKDVLGTPLLSSVFHADRWDYVFTLKRQGVAPQSFKYTVFFKGDLLERFEGDTMPSESEFIAKLDSGRKLGKVPPLEATEEQLKAAEKSSASKAASTPVAPAAAAGMSPNTAPAAYPPLESPRR
jgi:outer membrane protein assembly factor BamE